jgi:hypothetical protein
MKSIQSVAWNDFVDTAKWAKRFRDGNKMPADANERPLDVIRVRNESGAAVVQFGVLGLGDMVINPTDNVNLFKTQAWWKGIMPLEPKSTARFCVALEPLAINAIGYAAVGGVVPVQLSGDDQTKHYEFAEATASSTAGLHACSRGGARIVWREDAGDPRWALVSLEAWEQPDYPFGSQAVMDGTPSGAIPKLLIRAGKVYAPDGSGSVAEYCENPAASTYYFVQYTLLYDHSALTVTPTIQTSGSEPTWVTPTTGGLIFKWTVCQTDALMRVVWRWVGGDIHAPQIDTVPGTWGIHFKGTVSSTTVDVATGTIMCYDQKWVIPKLDAISLATPADVYVAWSSYPAKTPTFTAPTVITVDTAMAWDKFAKINVLNLDFKLLIGRIRAGVWEQCFWGDLNGWSTGLQPDMPADLRWTYQTSGKYVMHQEHTDVGLEGEHFFKGGWVGHDWRGGNLEEVSDKTLMRFGGKTCDNDLSYVDGITLSHTGTGGCTIAFTKQKWQFETTKGLVQKCELASDTGGSLSMTEVTVLTALQYDSSSHQLQVKKRVIHVPCADAEGSWELAFQAVSQIVLVSVSLSASYLDFGRKTLWVFQVESASDQSIPVDDCED